MAQNIDIKADLNQAIGQILKFQDAFNGVEDATIKVATNLIKVNESTGKVTQTINGVTAAGEKFKATLIGTGNEMKVVSLSTQAANSSMKDLAGGFDAAAKAAEKAEQAIKRQAREVRAAAREARETARFEQQQAARQAKIDAGIDPNAPKPPPSPKGENLTISAAGILRLAESQVIRQGIRALIDLFAEGVRSAVEFSVSIARIQTVAQQANISTQQWVDSLSLLSGKFATLQADVASAAYIALQSQLVKGKDTTDLLATALKLGEVVNVSAADSVRLLTGTLQAYRLPASDAERVSAIFFKTIQSGQVDAKELAENFGRIGSTASVMGVKLEEVAAAITTLTQRGVKFSDAAALISTLLSKAQKPTEELQKLFIQLGAASGENLIGKEGFGGFLKLLDKQAQEGNTRLGELLGQFKAVRAAANLTGGAFDDFNNNLSRIQNGADDFDKASQTVKASLGRNVQSEFTKVRNFFTNEFGPRFLSGLVEISNFIGGDEGMVGAIKRLGAAIATAAVSLAAFKVAALGLSGFGLVGLGIGAGVALGGAASIFNPIGPSGTDVSRKAANDEKARQDAAANDSAGRAQKRADADLVAATRESYNSRYKILLEYTSRVVQVADILKKRSIDNLKDIEEAVKVSGKTFTDSIREKLADLRRDITEARTLIKQSLRISEDLPRQGSNAIFQEKLKFAFGGEEGFGGLVINDQKAALIKNRIIELTNLAREEFKKGTKESVEEARRLFTDAQKLETQLFTEQTEIRRKVGEQQIARGTAPTDSAFQRSVGPDGKVRYEFTVQTAVIEERINNLTRERLALEANFRKEQEARKKNLEEQAQAERDRLRTITQLLEQAGKFKVTDDQGKVKKEYKDDPQLAARQFDEIVTKIRAATKDEEFVKQFQLFGDLYRQRIAVVQAVEAQITAERATAYQTRAVQDAQAAQATITAQQGILAAARRQLNEAKQELEGFLAVINQKALNKATGTSDNPFGAVLSAFRSNSIDDNTDANNGKTTLAFNAAKAKEAEVLAAREALSTQQTVANAEILVQKLRELRTATEDYIKARTGLSQEQLKGTLLPGDRGPNAPSVETRLNSGVQNGVNILNSLKAIEQAQATLRATQERAAGLDQTFQGIPESLRALGPISTETQRALSTDLQNIGGDVNKLINKYRELQITIQGLNQALPERRGNRAEAEGQLMGGLMLPKYFNSGGVSWTPRGSDQIPAMLAKDEFVVNAQATRKFLPQLQAINQMQQPSYYNHGGQVNNVGDIHVHVTGGNTPQATIHQIAAGLRRELKRGTVRLD
jgi:TP901 family phage tail tape measure protein